MVQYSLVNRHPFEREDYWVVLCWDVTETIFWLEVPYTPKMTTDLRPNKVNKKAIIGVMPSIKGRYHRTTVDQATRNSRPQANIRTFGHLIDYMFVWGVLNAYNECNGQDWKMLAKGTTFSTDYSSASFAMKAMKIGFETQKTFEPFGIGVIMGTPTCQDVRTYLQHMATAASNMKFAGKLAQ